MVNLGQFAPTEVYSIYLFFHTLKKTQIIIFITACITVSSCKMPQVAQQPYSKPLPESFADVKDSANSATISWKQFFTDKNLIGLIDSALLNNWDVQIALQRIQAAQSDVLFTKGALKPFVNGVVAPGITKFGDYTMDGAGNKGTEINNGKDIPKHLPDYLTGFQASWEIDAWGKLRNKKKAAAARFLSSVEGRTIVGTNLVAEIANAYFELLGFDQTLKIIDETILLQQNALAIVKVQKEAAVTNELAVKQFEAQLLNLQSFRLEIVQQIAETESRINFLAGRYPQPVVRDTSSFINTIPAQVKIGIPSALLRNRPDVRQAELEMMAAKADVQSAKAAFYPSINITAGIGLQAFKPVLLFKPESIVYGLLGSLTAPLINRSAIKAEFNFANAVQLEALYNYQKSIVNGYVEVYNEVLRIKNLQQVFELKTQEVGVLTQSIDISTDLFRFGRANYLEVLITQQNSLNARLELVRVKKEQFRSTANLYKALGGGWQ